MIWTQNQPKSGDLIRVKVNFYYHYGIFKDNETVIQFGLPDNSNTPSDQIKVLTTDIYTFSNGAFIETAKYEGFEKLKKRPPEQIINTAMSRLGEGGYNILNNNCEHFATECVFGERSSFLDDVREKIRQKLNNNKKL